MFVSQLVFILSLVPNLIVSVDATKFGKLGLRPNDQNKHSSLVSPSDSSSDSEIKLTAGQKVKAALKALKKKLTIKTRAQKRREAQEAQEAQRLELEQERQLREKAEKEEQEIQQKVEG